MNASRRQWLGRGVACAVPLVAGGAYWAALRAPQPAGPPAATGGAAVTPEVCIVAPTLAYDAASGRPPEAARDIPPDARCPVCGMYPARQPRWAAQVIYGDGHAHFLDSPLSLFHYLQRVERYAPGRGRADIKRIYVADQGSGRWLPASEAVYVHGSRSRGPMRSGNLPAFATVAQAEAFIAQHGGRVQAYDALVRELPPELQRLSPHTH